MTDRLPDAGFEPDALSDPTAAVVEVNDAASLRQMRTDRQRTRPLIKLRSRAKTALNRLSCQAACFSASARASPFTRRCRHDCNVTASAGRARSPTQETEARPEPTASKWDVNV